MSDYFMPTPSLHLKDENDLRAALDNPEYMDWPYPRKWHVRSDFIIGIIDEIAMEGKYPYNIDVQRRTEARLEIGQQNDNQSPLSVLVYNAQKFRHSDERIKAGYEPLSQELLDRAGEGAQIEVQGETIIGGMCTVLYNVRKIGEKLYAMQPRKRKYALSILGQPAKIVNRSALLF